MQAQLATRIESKIKRAVKRVCQSQGLKMNRFIEDALLDKLEELEDIKDLEKIQGEPRKPLEEVLKDLKLSGKL